MIAVSSFIQMQRNPGSPKFICPLPSIYPQHLQILKILCSSAACYLIMSDHCSLGCYSNTENSLQKGCWNLCLTKTQQIVSKYESFPSNGQGYFHSHVVEEVLSSAATHIVWWNYRNVSGIMAALCIYSLALIRSIHSHIENKNNREKQRLGIRDKNWAYYTSP